MRMVADGGLLGNLDPGGHGMAPGGYKETSAI